MARVISTLEKLECARRELQMRRRVYPRWIEKGRTTAHRAAHEIECMEAIAADYEEIAKKGDADMNEERDEQMRQLPLDVRVRLFRKLGLPGQPQYMHMGTSYLVEDLWKEIQRLQAPGPEVKCLEIRDDGTFVPVICMRPVPRNGEQRYLLRRDGYRGDDDEGCIIMIDAQCRGVAYDPYDWKERTKKVAHNYITEHWSELSDGDVVDVEFILGEKTEKKVSERVSYPA